MSLFETGERGRQKCDTCGKTFEKIKVKTILYPTACNECAKEVFAANQNGGVDGVEDYEKRYLEQRGFKI